MVLSECLNSLNWWYDSMCLITRRSKIWVINCRRDDLMKKDANYLYNQCRMCDEHFDASQFMDPASKRSLVWDAIPTIFPVRNPQHLLTPKTLSALVFRVTELITIL